MAKKYLFAAGGLLLTILISGFISNLFSKKHTSTSSISYAPTETLKSSNAQTITSSEISIPTGWTQYEIGETYTLAVPETLELRHDYDVYTRWLADSLGLISNADAVFQQKKLSTLSKDGMSTYARIMIQKFPCSPGETERHNEYPLLTDADYRYLDEMVEAEVVPASFIEHPSWRIIAINDNMAIEGRYRRSGTEGPVNCRLYLLSNYDEIVKLIIAYREKDQDLWAEDLDKVIHTFNWKYPK